MGSHIYLLEPKAKATTMTAQSKAKAKVEGQRGTPQHATAPVTAHARTHARARGMTHRGVHGPCGCERQEDVKPGPTHPAPHILHTTHHTHQKRARGVAKPAIARQRVSWAALLLAAGEHEEGSHTGIPHVQLAPAHPATHLPIHPPQAGRSGRGGQV